MVALLIGVIFTITGHIKAEDLGKYVAGLIGILVVSIGLEDAGSKISIPSKASVTKDSKRLDG
jgi:hypothetical protein